FKPHVGALILLSALIYLILNRSNFGRRALWSILLAGAFLFLVGFIADPAWHINYPKMLLDYQGEGNVSSCSECASLPVWLSRWLFDGSLSKAMMIAVMLLIVLVGIFLVGRTALLKSPELLLATALSITLLSSPYLYNYDFLLLLVPFAVLIRTESNLFQRLILILFYLVPTFAIALYGRDGNISLLFVTILITILLYSKSKVDVPVLAS
ncbi:MAG TPA: hypothetical protein VJM08_02415, partial [Anaerolineales bacterium]|nr:hypothetical protein [Anaerolineales bacterium]